MKIKLLVLLILLSAGKLTAQNKLTVVVDGFEKLKGSIRVGLFNSKEDFLKKPILRNSKPVKDKKESIVFENLQPGTYAVSLFHDENDDKKLDKNLLGIPKERIGFSNNRKIKFGAPPFSDCKFHFEKDTTVTIRLVSY